MSAIRLHCGSEIRSDEDDEHEADSDGNDEEKDDDEAGDGDDQDDGDEDGGGGLDDDGGGDDDDEGDDEKDGMMTVMAISIKAVVLDTRLGAYVVAPCACYILSTFWSQFLIWSS